MPTARKVARKPTATARAAPASGPMKAPRAAEEEVMPYIVARREAGVRSATSALAAGIMPPADEARPNDEERRQLFNWIESDVFHIDPDDPDPGRVTLRRLNRVEYRNTIRDLMGIDYDTNEEFPADDSGYGFDNIGDVLSMSPLLLEKYLHAAERIVTTGRRTSECVEITEGLRPGELVVLDPGGLRSGQRIQLEPAPPSSSAAASLSGGD